MMWLLLSFFAFAAAPDWAGVPLSSLDHLQLADVTVADGASLWQAADGHGGWVRLRWFSSVDAAKSAFAFDAGSATTVPQATTVVSGADEARGDGAAWLEVRSRNVVVSVRAQDGAASTRMRSVLAALVPEGTTTTVPSTIDAATWDGFGRRLVDLPH